MTLAEFAHISNTQGHLHILWMALFLLITQWYQDSINGH